MQDQVCNFSRNRIVHLARCDVLFEFSVMRTREALEQPPSGRNQLVVIAIGLLQSALDNAVMASRAACASPQEKSFVRFLRMVLCYLRSANALLDNEQELKNADSQLWRFLTRGSSPDRVLEFCRSSEQLLNDVVQLFEMARAPLDDLHRALRQGMSADDRSRYSLAQDALRAQYGDLEGYYRNHTRPNFLFNS